MSDPAGYIQDDLDLKMVVLYLMSRVIKPVTFNQILEMALFLDGGIDYFALTEAVADMVSTGQLTRDGDLYAITEKGRRNSAICESSLPVSVRRHGDENLLQLNEELRISDQIQAGVEEQEDGTCLLHLKFSDGISPLLQVDLLVNSLEEGRKMAARFRRNPAGLYYAVVEQLVSQEEG